MRLKLTVYLDQTDYDDVSNALQDIRDSEPRSDLWWFGEEAE